MADALHQWELLESVELAVRTHLDDLAYVRLWDRTDRSTSADGEDLGRVDVNAACLMTWLPARTTRADGAAEPPDLVGGVMNWLRVASAGANVEGVRTYRVRLYRPKGEYLASLSFRCTYVRALEQAEQTTTIPAPPSPEAERQRAEAGAWALITGQNRAIGDAVERILRLSGEQMKLQSDAFKAAHGLQGDTIKQQAEQIAAKDALIDQLTAAVLGMKMERTRTEATVDAETHATELRHQLAQQGMNSVTSLLSLYVVSRMGLPAELAELGPAIMSNPELLAALSDPNLKVVLGDPELSAIAARAIKEVVGNVVAMKASREQNGANGASNPDAAPAA